MSLIVVPIQFVVLPPLNWEEDSINTILSASNRFWSQADIHCLRTGVHRPTLAELRLPSGATLDPLNETALIHLLNTLRRGRFGIVTLLTSSGFAERKSIAGQGTIDTNFCALRRTVNTAVTGCVLAHELGHCFNLGDRNQPGNLMHGAIHGTGSPARLTLEPFQIEHARSSRTVRSLGA